jgi:hypothetical protein
MKKPKPTSPLMTSDKYKSRASLTPLSNKNVISLADEMSSTNWNEKSKLFRKRLREELITRQIIYNYTNILTGKTKQYEFI